MRVQWKTHNTIITTSNQTTPDSHKFNIKAIWFGIVPVKLFMERTNLSAEWKMTSKHESAMKNTWQHNHYNKQPNNTQLTQIGHQGNLCRNRSRQTIAEEPQDSCRIKNESKHESTMKNTWQHNYYNKHPNNTRLTQICKQPNFTGNCAHQIIVVEPQVICRMKNDKQSWESNEKHMTTQS
jgi:hypothetical protein